MNYILLSIITVITIFSCGDEPLNHLKDFKSNRAPVITNFTSNYSNSGFEPGLSIDINIQAFDPEGKVLTFQFSSLSGSFSEQVDFSEESSVKFIIGNIQGGKEIIVNVVVTDEKGASTSQNLNIGKSSEGPKITLLNEINSYIPDNGMTSITFKTDSAGYYQVLVFDDVNQPTIIDSSKPFNIIEKDIEKTISICGPFNYNATCDNLIPRLNPVSKTPDKIALIVRDNLNIEASKEFIFYITGTAPTPGNNGNIDINNVTKNSAQLSWTFAQDTDTSQENLSYLVYYSENNKIDSIEEIETYGIKVANWNENINFLEISSLKSWTQYYFNVLTKDKENNTSSYKKATIRTLDNKVPVPGNLGTISAGNRTENSIELFWAPATDDTTTSSNLLYKVFISEKNNINTYYQINNYGTAITDWIKYQNSQPLKVQNLKSGTIYYYNIIVKDEDSGNSIYKMNFTETYDITAPIPGNGGLITVNNLTPSDFTLKWNKATDNSTTGNNLKYKIIWNSLDNISTLADAEKNGIAFGFEPECWEDDIDSYYLYYEYTRNRIYFNIIVKDEHDNKNVYQRLEVIMPHIHIFETSSDYYGNELSRNYADGFCSSEYNNKYSYLKFTNIRAFMSINIDDEIRDMPYNYNVPTNLPIRGNAEYGAAILANNWADLLDGSIDEYLYYIFSSFNNLYWTGSKEFGELDENNCDNWTYMYVYGTVGDSSYKDSNWLKNTRIGCDHKLKIMCIAW